MAKVIYEFDLNDPEDQSLREVYRDAETTLAGLHYFSGRLRNTQKYSNLTQNEMNMIEAIRRAFFQSMDNAGVKLDTFSDQGEVIEWEREK